MSAAKPPAYLAPPEYDLADVTAFQALSRGDASPDLQMRALKWLIEGAANTYGLSFDPQSDRGTAFAEGRRFVGLQVVKMLKLDASKLRKED